MSKEYWNTVWNIKDIDEYRKYLVKYNHIENDMIKIFKDAKIHDICDAACGFGANSLALYSNGFNVSGFDISEEAVKLTNTLLFEYGMKEKRFIQCSITNIEYADERFDAVTARAVLDHLSSIDVKKAINELLRITKKGGLLYASFDPLSEEDISFSHQVLADGSFLYDDGDAKGLLFRYYLDDEIKQLFCDFNIIYFNTDTKGNRHIIVRK